MRRPILLILIGFAAGILLCHWWMEGLFALWIKRRCLWVVPGLLILLMGLWTGKSRNTPGGRIWIRPALIVLTAAAGGVCCLLINCGQSLPLEGLAGQKAELWGVVQEVKETEYSVQVVLGHIKGREIIEQSSGKEQGENGAGREGPQAALRNRSFSGRKALVSIPKSRLSQWEGGWDDLVGRAVRVRGAAELPAGRRNPGCFDYRLYLKSKKIDLQLRNKGGVAVSRQVKAPVAHKIAWLRQRFSDEIQKRMPEEEAGLFLAMLFGDRTLLEDELYDSFRKNGISHVLAVSGLHVGLVFVWVNRALGKRKTLLYALISSGFLIFYGAMAFFSPSVVRAMLMIFVRTGAGLLHRRYDMTCSAAAAGILMLVCNPFLLFHAGFQLSFLAVFSLAVLLPRFQMLLNRRAKPVPQRLASPVLTMVAVQGAMTPVTAYLFQYVSWTGLLVNVPVLTMAGLLIPCGILLLLLFAAEGLTVWLAAVPIAGHLLQTGVHSLFSLTEGATAAFAHLLLKGMIALSRFFSSLKIGGRWVTSPDVGFVMFFLVSLFFLSSERFQLLCRKGSRTAVKRILTVMGLAGLLLSLCAPQLAGYGLSGDRPEFVFVDVGQGDCLHIRTPSGKNVLIDGGGSTQYPVGKKTLLPYLLKNGVSHIDLAIATHLHQDHFGGLAELAGEISVEKLGTYRANALRPEVITEKSGIPEDRIVYLAAGDRIQLDQDCFVEVLYPFPQTEEVYEEMNAQDADENKSSLLLKVTVHGFSVLMTGDMGFPGEQDVMKAYGKEGQDGDPLQVSVLKIGHHGSRYSTGQDFLDRVSPKAAVIQVGKNNFGHPSPGVIVKCQNSGIMVYRNDLQGAVMFTRKKGNRWTADCMIPGVQEATWPIHPKQKGSIPTKKYKEKSKKRV